jgi:hypothetical protein
VNTTELKERLFEEGCNPLNYSIGLRGEDVYCLMQKGNKWQVFYSERGNDSTPIFQSESESEACAFYFDHIMKIVHNHCVGFFKSEQRAGDLKKKLQASGVAFTEDKIPYNGPSYPRYRIFVRGKAIFAARACLGDLLPIEEK